MNTITTTAPVKKPTNKAIKAFIKDKLATNRAWALKALTTVHSYQTESEQLNNTTFNQNGEGFTGADAFILTQFTDQYNNKGYLSPKQMAIVYRKMPKYWKQILNSSNREHLYALIQA